ncbi:restriction endonuclease [Flavobacterium sp. RHBU_3]|uniref:restriction endonuclease n=1 Tax=Flavobacterium sp. RHBU_3 TaxID=3391184 RepID=UPI0039850EA2
MKRSEISRTHNPLHFEDLDHRRFEDLVFNILFRCKKWYKLNHLGSAGADDGIDIEGIQKISEKEFLKTLIQCKRYKSISPSQIEKIVRDIHKGNKEYKVLYLVISCSLTKRCYDKLEDLKIELEYDDIFVWSRSTLEAYLYNEFSDLLYIYFGFGNGNTLANKIDSIKKRIEFRDLLKSVTMKPFNSSEDLLGNHRFKYSKFIIRSVFDSDSETFQDEFGWYSYFGVEPYHITDEGIIVDYYSGSGIIKRKLLSFDKIYLIDLDSSEARPILYCQYVGDNGPFEIDTPFL